MREREYIRAVLRASGLPGSVRRRLRADLESDFAARRAPLYSLLERHLCSRAGMMYNRRKKRKMRRFDVSL